MRVMPINTPGRQDSLRKAILTRAADMIHDLIAAIFDNSFSNTTGNVVEYLVSGAASIGI